MDVGRTVLSQRVVSQATFVGIVVRMWNESVQERSKSNFA